MDCVCHHIQHHSHHWPHRTQLCCTGTWRVRCIIMTISNYFIDEFGKSKYRLQGSPSDWIEYKIVISWRSPGMGKSPAPGQSRASSCSWWQCCFLMTRSTHHTLSCPKNISQKYFRNDPTSQITSSFILVLFHVISSLVLWNTLSLSSHFQFVIAQY